MSLNTVLTPRQNFATLRKKYGSGRGFDVLFSLRNRYVFFPIGKVANSSLKWALYKMEGNPIKVYERKWNRHERLVHDQFYGPLVSYFQLEKSRELVSEAIFGGGFFRFAFVRSPYSRLLAAYLDRAQTRGTTLHRALIKRFGSTDVDFPTFCEFIADHEDATTLETHVRPQSVLLYGGEVPLDFVGRFETLGDDFSTVTNRIYGSPSELEFQSPSRTNAGTQLSQYYTSKLIELVNKVYIDDFRMFKYDKLTSI